MPDALARRVPPESKPAPGFDPMDSPAVKRAGERLVGGHITVRQFDAIVAAERARWVKRRVREVAEALRAS